MYFPWSLNAAIQGSGNISGSTSMEDLVEFLSKESSEIPSSEVAVWVDQNQGGFRSATSLEELYRVFEEFSSWSSEKILAGRAKAEQERVSRDLSLFHQRTKGRISPVGTREQAELWASESALPQTIYHATRFGSAILQTGLKTRHEVGHSSLGAGPNNMVSTTPSYQGARRIAALFQMLHEARTQPHSVLSWLEEKFAPALREHAPDIYERLPTDMPRRAWELVNKTSFFVGTGQKVPAYRLPALMGYLDWLRSPAEPMDIGVIHLHALVDAVYSEEGSAIQRWDGKAYYNSGFSSHTLCSYPKRFHRPPFPGAEDASMAWSSGNPVEEDEIRVCAQDVMVYQFEPVLNWRDILDPDTYQSHRSRAPGYQSWSWIQQDWRSLRISKRPRQDKRSHRKGVDYSLKCGEEGSRLPSGKPSLCLPRTIIEQLLQTASGTEILKTQIRKKAQAPKGERVSWHPRIKNLHKTLPLEQNRSVRSSLTEQPWMPYRHIKPVIRLMEHWGISEIARGPYGFLKAYKKSGYSPKNLSSMKATDGLGHQQRQDWRTKRNGFNARHQGKMEKDSRPFWVLDPRYPGMFWPYPQHLSLVAWAHTPDWEMWEDFLDLLPSVPEKNWPSRRKVLKWSKG